MRIGYRLLVACALAAGLFPRGAFAQVAAPELILGAPRLFESDALGLGGAAQVPDNPALMIWPFNSEIGAGFLSGGRESQDPLLGASQSGSGRFYGFRAHFNDVAIGFESLDYTVNFSAASHSVRQRTRAGAVKANDWLAVGFSHATEDRRILSGGILQSDSLWSMTHSLSIKMGEDYFAGLGLIQDHYLSQTSLSHGSREGYLVGLGYLGGIKPMVVHVEYSLYHRPPVDGLQATNLGQGVHRGLAVLELGYNFMVVGYSQDTVQRSGRAETSRGQTFSVGYSQAGYLAFSLRHEQRTLAVGALQEKEAVTSLVLSYQFWGLKANPSRT